MASGAGCSGDAVCFSVRAGDSRGKSEWKRKCQRGGKSGGKCGRRFAGGVIVRKWWKPRIFWLRERHLTWRMYQHIRLAYVAVNGNVPYFTDADLTDVSFESYSDLDSLGRCGVAYASVSQDTMPTEKRGSIGEVKPTGWHTAKYDNVDGKYLYNRCHLIGYQLTAENANVKNLITGTRYLNVQGMLPFENLTADYVKETGNHVMYRVTPVFEGGNLVASGVLMEAESVEDQGEGVLFCVYVYNVQPGIAIDYATGESWADGSGSAGSTAGQGTAGNGSSQNQSAGSGAAGSSGGGAGSSGSSATVQTYILNTNSKKFHLPSCTSVTQMKAANRQEFTGTRDEVIADGYEPCKNCNP